MFFIWDQKTKDISQSEPSFAVIEIKCTFFVCYQHPLLTCDDWRNIYGLFQMVLQTGKQEIQSNRSIIISCGAKVPVSEWYKKLFCVEASSLIHYSISWPSPLDQAVDSWVNSQNSQILQGLRCVHNFLPKVISMTSLGILTWIKLSLYQGVLMKSKS